MSTRARIQAVGAVCGSATSSTGERVFERFVRLDDARPADGRNGLGLAIVREVVGRHGGTVAVDPDFASGTRIMVTFPRSPVD